MDFFPALGFAVLGIFATVMLTGSLAGIIAFGFIDGGMRSQIQLNVVASARGHSRRSLSGSQFLRDVVEAEREDLQFVVGRPDPPGEGSATGPISGNHLGEGDSPRSQQSV